MEAITSEVAALIEQLRTQTLAWCDANLIPDTSVEVLVERIAAETQSWCDGLPRPD